MSDEIGRPRLKVLHVILNLGHTNGQYNEHCLPMVEKREISILTYFPPQLIPPRSIRLFDGDGTIKGFFKALREALDDGDYDVIHDHAPQSGALVVLALLLMVRLHRIRPSMVYTVQDSFYDYSRRNQLLMLVAMLGYKRIIFCSRAAYDSVPGLWTWLIRGRWTVVQNGADIERVDRALEGHRGESPGAGFALLSVARLEPVKDLGTLMEAFARVSTDESRLLLIGAGSLEDELKAEARRGEMDGVDFLGLVPRDEVFTRCANADLLVSTSLGEGLPVAVIEAMAARCPVVLSDIPPHRELADGEDFIPLVPTGDVDGFSREIARFQAMTPEERRAIGDRSREHVLARFTLPIMHAGVESVYRSLASVKRRVST